MNHQALAESILHQNSVLYKKISENCRIPQNDVPVALSEVVRFLDLIARSGEILTPSKAVDDVWHEFILCTKAYTDFCEQNFGRYIHHHPGGDHKKNQAQFHKTLELYREFFGEPNSKFWGKHNVLKNEADCGSCEAR